MCPLSDREIEEALLQSELFGGLTASQRKRLLQEAQKIPFKKGEEIDNDEGLELFNIVVKGAVKLVQQDPDSGRSLVLFLLKRGEGFDWLSLLDGDPHYSRPVAVEPSCLLRLPMATMRAWVEEWSELNERVLPYLGRQMRHLERFAESVVFDDTATRLARLILHHTAPAQSRDAHGDLLPVRIASPLSQELLAEMIGSVRTVVTTQLKKMKEEGLIVHERGRLAVKRLEELVRRYNL